MENYRQMAGMGGEVPHAAPPSMLPMPAGAQRKEAGVLPYKVPMSGPAGSAPASAPAAPN